MRNWIKEWGAVFVIAMLLVAMGTMAFAEDGFRFPAKAEDAYELRWPTMTSASNTVGKCNPNGVTESLIATFTNTGSDVKSVWAQDSDIFNGVFTNATSSAIDVDPTDTDSFRHRESILGGPCWRLHSEDSDLGIANKLRGKIKLWSN